MYFSKISIDFDVGWTKFWLISSDFAHFEQKPLLSANKEIWKSAPPPSKSVEFFEKYMISGIGTGFVVKESEQRRFLLILGFWNV